MPKTRENPIYDAIKSYLSYLYWFHNIFVSGDNYAPRVRSAPSGTHVRNRVKG